MDALLAALKENRLSAINLSTKIGQKELLALLEKADRELSLRLRQNSYLKGKGSQSFTATQMRVTIDQIRAVTAQLTHGMQGLLKSQVLDATDKAVGNFIDYLNAAEKKFNGVAAQPLPIREVEMLNTVARGVNSTILKRLAMKPEAAPLNNPRAQAGILQRYGLETIDNFEQSLQQGMVQRKNWLDIRSDLVEDSPFLQGAPAHWAERLVRTECFIGDTLVSGAMVNTAFRRWYEGDVVTITTESGCNFTATPNHPMLTNRGWVAAGALNNSNYLISDGWKENSRSPSDEDINRRPTKIGEIFDSLSAIGIFSRRNGTNPDFHGDGRNGDIDVASSDRHLMFGEFIPIFKPFFQNILSPTDFSYFEFCLFCHRLLPIDERICGCHITDINSGIYNTAFNGSFFNSIFYGELLQTLTCLILINYFFNGQVFSESWMSGHLESILCGIGVISQDIFRFKDSSDRIRACSQSFSDFKTTQSFKIKFDRVASVKFSRFRGHVYNLSTKDGYYTVNGFYTGNCISAYNAAGNEAIKATNTSLGDMCKILVATFDERTSWDSYAVHGQIRNPYEPFETPYGLFLHPPARPNDREITIGHRISWKIPPALAWKTDEQVIARYHMQRKSGSPGERPKMTTIPLERFGR